MYRVPYAETSSLPVDDEGFACILPSPVGMILYPIRLPEGLAWRGVKSPCRVAARPADTETIQPVS
jgi:hypothetical protein